MSSKRQIRKNLLIALIILIFGGLISSGIFGLDWQRLNKYIQIPPATLPSGEKIKITSEESVIINVVDRVSPAVVTVGISKTRRVGDMFKINPFNPFAPFERIPGKTQKIEQDIGSGFIVTQDGLIVTNKHVVADGDAKYRVITKNDQTYEAVKIYRDPTNDLAILKINAVGLPTVQMGNSDKVKVGQLAIAIGTALGEFRHTVTTGVISGVGRGIEAGSPFEGYVERLDNVIQTDAAINPGNSGGPLLNSAGQVVGINTAVSQEGQNIGFAIPINILKDALANFNSTGQFNRPFLGIRYKTISKDLAILNEVPEGAYIVEVVEDSPADKSGLQEEDIITKIDNVRLTGTNVELSRVISQKKIGESLKLTVWREGKEQIIQVTLGNQGE